MSDTVPLADFQGLSDDATRYLMELSVLRAENARLRAIFDASDDATRAERDRAEIIVTFQRKTIEDYLRAFRALLERIDAAKATPSVRSIPLCEYLEPELTRVRNVLTASDPR